MREVINGHLMTSPLAELPAELVEGEALCGGLVGNGLIIGVHDSPGLVTVMNLGCHPSMGGGRQGGRAWGGSSNVGWVGNYAYYINLFPRDWSNMWIGSYLWVCILIALRLTYFLTDQRFKF